MAGWLISEIAEREHTSGVKQMWSTPLASLPRRGILSKPLSDPQVPSSVQGHTIYYHIELQWGRATWNSTWKAFSKAIWHTKLSDFILNRIICHIIYLHFNKVNLDLLNECSWLLSTRHCAVCWRLTSEQKPHLCLHVTYNAGGSKTIQIPTGLRGSIKKETKRAYNSRVCPYHRNLQRLPWGKFLLCEYETTRCKQKKEEGFRHKE